MLELNTYLLFNGDCAEAFELYARLFQGEIVALLKHDQAPTPEPTSPELRGKIMHAALKIGASMLMGSDAPAAMYQKPQGFAVAATFPDVAQGERVFAALAERGTVRMPLAPTFWAQRFGDVVDRFGTPWMITAGPIEVPRS